MTTLPTIHLNGTGPQTLRDDYHSVYQAVREVVVALEKAEFNPRDFYPQGDDAWAQARKERGEVFQKLREVQEYAMSWYIHADDRC